MSTTANVISRPELVRFADNPVLKPEPDCPWGRCEARNTAAYYDGKQVHLLFTAGTNSYQGNPLYLGHAVSDDGYTFRRDPEPWLSPSGDRDDFDFGTVEDPRITELEGQVYVTYAARWFTFHVPSVGVPDYHRKNGRLGLTWNDEHSRRTGLIKVTSPDFSTYEKLGPLTLDTLNDANTMLFPEKIGGRYALLHRPSPFRPHKWNARFSPVATYIAFSDTLMPWDWSNFEDDSLLLLPEQKWEAYKTGGSGPPIKTPEGWLMFYHAVDWQDVYRCGLALLDLEDPRRVIARTPEPVLEPELDNEKQGRVNNVVFPCGNVLIGDELFIYYGAADTDTNLITAKLSDLLEFMKTCRR